MLKQVVHIIRTVKGLKRPQWDSLPSVHPTSFAWNIQAVGRGSIVNGMALAVMKITEMNKSSSHIQLFNTCPLDIKRSLPS
jgi:hypothetical protein